MKQRLSIDTEAYKELYRKYDELECSTEFNYENEESNVTTKSSNESLNNVAELDNSRDSAHGDESEQDKKTEAEAIPSVDVVVQQCPVCCCEFSPDLSIDAKTEHIEQHFA